MREKKNEARAKEFLGNESVINSLLSPVPHPLSMTEKRKVERKQITSKDEGKIEGGKSTHESPITHPCHSSFICEPNFLQSQPQTASWAIAPSTPASGCPATTW